MATGNAVTTASITAVPLPTVRNWIKQPWWKEMKDSFYADDKQELDAKYQKIIRKALDVTEDRLDNGNFQLDQKTGKVVRVPVSIGDSHRVMKDLVDQQQALRQDKTAEVVAQEAVADKLAKLAEQFAKMTGRKVEKVVNPGQTYEHQMDALEVLDALQHERQERLQEGIREVCGVGESQEGPSAAQQGS